MKNNTNDLKGLHIIDAKINADRNTVFLNTHEGIFKLTWVGDCCAECYIEHFDSPENLKEAEILDVQNSEWKTLKENMDFEVIESMGTKFKTTKGYVNIETRLNHNGYYSGWIDVEKIDRDEYYKTRLKDQLNFEDDEFEIGELEDIKEF